MKIKSGELKYFIMLIMSFRMSSVDPSVPTPVILTTAPPAPTPSPVLAPSPTEASLLSHTQMQVQISNLQSQLNQLQAQMTKAKESEKPAFNRKVSHGVVLCPIPSTKK
jgi:hypothetical protein